MLSLSSILTITISIVLLAVLFMALGVNIAAKEDEKEARQR